MAASMLARLALQSARLTVNTLRHQTFCAIPNRSFSASPCSFGKKWFTEKHEWIDFEEKTSLGTVGISDYAQESLGEVVYVELPEPGAELDKHDSAGVVESVKAASDIYCPVKGTVVEVNSKLTEEPSLLNKSPMDEGWLFRLHIDNSKDLEELMDEDAYKKFLAEQEL